MSSNAEQKDLILSTNRFLVVGIGASAGGLEAFKQLIRAIPVDSGLAFILVQHLAPTHDSILCEILQKITSIPVHEVTDNVQVRPDHIYVIPSNKLLTANDGILNLSDRSLHLRDLPIDLFFRSLAEVHQSSSIGVVLSGTGRDGTLGLKAIREAGGVTFAQDHTSSAFNEMPQSAVQANVVDFVLSPEEIVEKLIALTGKFKRFGLEGKAIDVQPEDLVYKQILSAIDLLKGVDFTYYKQTTIRRRIARRMVMKNLAKPEDYLHFLKEKPDEVNTLFQDILIPVTDFFRDDHTFENLLKTAIPALSKNKKPNASFRVWSVGCSTGQEAYSIAISLHEHFSAQPDSSKIQIFATDISETGITQARSGFYLPADVTNVSPERLEKYFNKVTGGYQLNKVIRESCVFATHNVLTNPPFAGIDLIICRNVLIYMDNFLQRKAMATFHYSLNEKAMLFLGRSESIGNSSDLFSTFSEPDKIYTRNSVPGRFIHINAKRRIEFLSKEADKIPKDNRAHDDFQRSADELLLSRSPAGVIVNEGFEILQFRGITADWLESPSGKPSINVLKMAKSGLQLDLRNALQKAKSTKLPFTKEGIVLEMHGVKKLVTVEVIPLGNTINVYYLILFRNMLEIPITPTNGKSKANGKKTAQELRALQLEKELSQTREDMRAITEDQEAGNEELLSANEELLSGSEELRSLNEELEISKEELQSTVEELSVANQELAFRNDELNYSRKYSEAIVSTISQPLIVLDKELRIRSANNAFYKNFHYGEKETEGKYFGDIDEHQWNIPELIAALLQVINGSNFIMHLEVKTQLKRSGDVVMLLSARRILSEVNSEPLVLVAMEDITIRKNQEQLIRSEADYARSVLDSNPIITATAGPAGNVTYSNKFFLDYSGITLDEAVATGWVGVIHPDQNDDVANTWMKSVAEGKDFFKEILLKRRDGVYRWHAAHALPIRDGDGKITSWVSSAADIHDQKTFSNELEKQIVERTINLKESNTQLEHSNKNLEQFAFIASHDLQEPLRKIKTFTSMISVNYKDHLPLEGNRLIDRIHNSADRMSALIADVLNFSRIDNSESAFVKTDLNSILSSVLDDFSLLIQEKNAMVKVENLPVIEAVPLQINQLFYNLLSNSLKFTSLSKQPVISITSRKFSMVEVMKLPELNPKFSYFEILIADNGIGFDEKHKDKLFEIFQRLHQQQEYGGTGIGLALCKRIVINHHGTIFAEGHENAGALFHVVLPLNEHHTAVELMPGYRE